MRYTILAFLVAFVVTVSAAGSSGAQCIDAARTERGIKHIKQELRHLMLDLRKLEAGLVRVPASKKPKATPAPTAATPVATPVISPAAAPVVKPSQKSFSSSRTPTKKPAPVVKDASKDSVVKGADKALSGFAGSGALPQSLADKLKEEIQKAIDAQLKPSVVTLTQVKTVMPIATSALNSTEGSGNSTSNSTMTAPAIAARPTVVTLTEIRTQTQYTNDSIATAAALNIQKALQSAFAAANVSQSDLSADTMKSLEKCLTTVMAAGGLPEGYSCLTSTGADGAGLTSTLNTILEQFVGILPNVVLENVFDAVTPILGNLLPDSENALISQIQDTIQSVIASLSGNSVTALEQIQQCYVDAVKHSGNSSALACITKPGGAMSTLQTATNGVLEQFVGVLPASLTTAVENIFTYNLQGAAGSSPNATLAAEVSAQISNAINSVASTLSGNTVTLAQTLQACAAQLIATGDAKAAKDCITQGDAPQIASTMLLGISEQFAGYLPSSFFTDLTKFSEPYVSGANSTSTNPTNASQAEINAAFDEFFNSESYGPAYVTCLHQVQACVVNAITKKGSISAVCPGPVKGCETIKATANRRRARALEEHERFSRWVRRV